MSISKPFTPSKKFSETDLEPLKMLYNSTNVRNYLNRINNIISHFWKRFKKELSCQAPLIPQIQKYKTMNENRLEISIGDIALIENDYQPRLSWKIRIIVEFFC